ncbi:restriction endonuclease subunit S [Streptomyces sp. NPDC055036]
MTFDAVPLKSLITDAQTGPFGTQLNSDEYIEGGIPVINPSNIKDGRLIVDQVKTVSEATADRLRMHQLLPGDLVFARRGELGRAAVASDKERGWLCGTGSIRVRMKQGLIDPSFTGYALQSAEVRSYFEQRAVGSTMENLNTGIVIGLPFPRPSMDEQRRIADFLDVETARIDQLSTLMQAQEALLAVRRKVVMGRAWEAETPVVRLGHFLQLVTSGPRGWGDYASDQGNLFFRSANLRRDSITPNLDSVVQVAPPASAVVESMRSMVRSGDVLVGITGANTGWVAHADERVFGANVSQHVCLLRPTPSVQGTWLAYLLSSSEVQHRLLGSQYGGTKTQLSLPDLRDLRVPIPNFECQVQLAKEIGKDLGKTEGERQRRKRQLKLLAERRQALITAAVTGQFDVTTASGRGVDAS